jgi:transposase InsO family protein
MKKDKMPPIIKEAHCPLRAFIRFYNKERLHQALKYEVPESVYRII